MRSCDACPRNVRESRRRAVQDPGTLFNHFLWNGARVISDYLQLHPSVCEGKSVLEFGAAAAIPSIVASRLGAKLTVATDYPDPKILSIMQLNIDTNATSMPPGTSPPVVKGACCACAAQQSLLKMLVCVATGHLWGTPCDDILALNAEGGGRYDVLLLADVLWLHDKVCFTWRHVLLPMGC